MSDVIYEVKMQEFIQGSVEVQAVIMFSVLNCCLYFGLFSSLMLIFKCTFVYCIVFISQCYVLLTAARH